jgi:hypothetical protein
MPPPEKLPDCIISSVSIFKTWSYVLPWQNFAPSTPNLEETLIVVIKQGGTAEAAISAVLKRIDSMIKCSPFLITKVAPKGEIVKESDILITTL